MSLPIADPTLDALRVRAAENTIVVEKAERAYAKASHAYASNAEGSEDTLAEASAALEFARGRQRVLEAALTEAEAVAAERLADAASAAERKKGERVRRLQKSSLYEASTLAKNLAAVAAGIATLAEQRGEINKLRNAQHVKGAALSQTEIEALVLRELRRAGCFLGGRKSGVNLDHGQPSLVEVVEGSELFVMAPWAKAEAVEATP